MAELPTGTVTFLFTDIEGSTRLLHELGPERYAQALAEHRRALREAFAAQGGVEVDTQGDAFFFAFEEASAALRAAEQGQRALSAGPIRVRIGVHTGEARLAGEGYVGMEVHKGARIAAAGHGGQVLVSEATRIASGRELRSLGPHRLKDLSAPEPLWQRGGGEFPPPASLNQSNLPIQRSPLVGRERELAEAGALLGKERIITLVGPGGSGKTRLALQLAAEALEDFPHGVWWVPLQALRDPELVLPTIASTLGAQRELAEHLAGKRILLLLDNLEQLVESAAALAGAHRHSHIQRAWSGQLGRHHHRAPQDHRRDRRPRRTSRDDRRLRSDRGPRPAVHRPLQLRQRKVTKLLRRLQPPRRAGGSTLPVRRLTR